MSGYKLRRYQQKAVEEVLSGIDSAQRLFLASEAKKRSAVILSAPTGAGKTVMAGTVIDILLSRAVDEDRDPDTVLLWVTDAPALNRQSATKIEKASSGRVKTIVLSGSGGDFDQETFDPGVLYLLNVQAAGKNAGLSNHSDSRTFSIWDTISNTALEYGPNFVVIIDEAHRGAKKTKQQAGEDDTIVGQITDAAPVVFGISATEQRFRDRMKEKRREPFPVDVSVTDVSGEGMIKTSLILKKPSEKDAHVTLLKHSVRDTLEFEKRWARHYEGDGDGELILPALIVQVRNGSLAPKKPEDNDGFKEELTEFVKAILDEWEGLEPESIVNVFGEHETLELGEHNGKPLNIAYMRPDDIASAVVSNNDYNGTHDVRVVIAKDAITTGWDCPRAEVLISYRSAKEETYITQLIGRMIRNPLAHTVQSDDFLNNAHCTLPYFDKDELERLTKKLKDEDGIEARVSDAEPVTYERALALDDRIFKALEGISSYHIPRRNDTYYLGLLRYLSGNLAVDGIVADAAEKTDQFLCQRLDFLTSKKSATFERLLEKTTISIDRWNMKMVEDSEEEYDSTEIVEMDISDVIRKYGLSNQVFGDGFRETYIKYLVDTRGVEVEDAKRRVMVLSEDTFEARAELEGASKKRFLKLLKDNADAISLIASEERRSVYDSIMDESDEPTLRRIAEAPTSIQENIDGSLLRKAQRHGEKSFEEARARVISNAANHFESHIYTAEEVGGGKYLAKFNRWEREVLRIEVSDPSCRGWYRNPPQGQRSVAIKYVAKDGAWAGIHPDFILFHEVDGVIKPSIADPHGNHLEDFVIKMRGWYEYAEEHHGEFHSLRPSTEFSHELRYLELTDANVRAALGAEMEKDDPKPMRVFRDYGKVYRWQGNIIVVSADDLIEDEVVEPHPVLDTFSPMPRGINGEQIMYAVPALAATTHLLTLDYEDQAEEVEVPVAEAVGVTDSGVRNILAQHAPVVEEAAPEMLGQELREIASWVVDKGGSVDRQDLTLEVEALLEMLEIDRTETVVAALCNLVWGQVESLSGR